jgi:thioredoxin reductase (NADPH)
MRDVIIVGAGPAGLMAATYLGRFHRRPLVIDSGQSRARWIPSSHNIPGFMRGISGADLLAHLRAQATQYGAEIRSGTVTSMTRQKEGIGLQVDSLTVSARYVLLATGVKDHFPPLAGAADAVLRSVLRVCPICDGFEATGKKIAVIGDGELGHREAQFLYQTYSKDVSYLYIGGDAAYPSRTRPQGGQVSVRQVNLSDFRLEGDALWLVQADRPPERYDFLYCALGCTPQQQLGRSLGALCDENAALRVGPHQETTVDRLYAAGDVVRGLNQVVIAAAEAAIAATDIHNRLRTENICPDGSNGPPPHQV